MWFWNFPLFVLFIYFIFINVDQYSCIKSELNWDIKHLSLLSGTAPSSWSLATARCEKDLLWIFGIPASSCQLLGNSCFCWHACMHRSLEQGQHICRQVIIVIEVRLISVWGVTHTCGFHINPPTLAQRKLNFIQVCIFWRVHLIWMSVIEGKSAGWNMVIVTAHRGSIFMAYQDHAICNPEIIQPV